MSTQTTLDGDTTDHPTKNHLTKERPEGSSLTAAKNREWFCLHCQRRVTEGPDGIEYGHENKNNDAKRSRCQIRDEQGMA